MTINLKNKGGGITSYGITSPAPATDSYAKNTDSFTESLIPCYPGFYGNGDYFVFSSSSAASSLQYYDNTHTLVWTLNRNSGSTSADKWLGMTIDRTNQLVYGVSYYSATSNIGYLLSIDPAGTITKYNLTLTSNSATLGVNASLTQSPTDSNKLVLRYGSTTAVYERTFNKDGTSQSQNTIISSSGLIRNFPFYKTSNGIYHGLIVTGSQTNTSRIAISTETVTKEIILTTPYANFPAYSTQGSLLEWGDHYTIMSAIIYEPTSSIYNKVEYDAWIDRIATLYGLL